MGSAWPPCLLADVLGALRTMWPRKGTCLPRSSHCAHTQGAIKQVHLTSMATGTGPRPLWGSGPSSADGMILVAAPQGRGEAEWDNAGGGPTTQDCL